MKYIVLLRGVNIGGRKVKSAELRDCFVKAGFKDPQTVLATGNVIIETNLSSEKLKPQVEELLQKTFDFAIKVLVIPIEQLLMIIENYPFTAIDEAYHRHIIFQNKNIEKPNIKLDNAIEDIRVNGDIMYWYVLKGHTLDSTFAKHLAKTSKKEFATTRNINTLNKIIKKAKNV